MFTKRRTLARLGTALTASAALLGAALVSATPAQAATSCSAEQHKEMDTPGANVDVYIKLCFRSHYNDAMAYVRWADAGGYEFDNFDLHLRLERNDAVVGMDSFDLTDEINNWGASDSIELYGAPTSVTSGSGWSADGYVKYNIDGDGKGDFTWSLTGSPEISS
ncbi:hypothetical protein GA0070606_1656 [Micromonospora citrea]|uniref:Uncharacterized protein n=1 Tax=Micromonospora citrea TaxID=47855 RepID=A0A1C6U969_9ACTN|nr:hypothetical protein [Micromonospora citrea]SCL50572.1 hypothetical protein GA0070606_1656 [Micromonospora citrea]